MRGDVEVRMVTCGQDRKSQRNVCDEGSMVLHADTVDYNETTGEIHPSGNVRIAPYRATTRSN